MSEVVIQVENLSKLYRLGLVGTTTMKDDLRRAWAKLRGKPDPTLPVDHPAVNQLSVNHSSSKGKKEPNNREQITDNCPPDNDSPPINRELITNNYSPNGEYIWALRNISFEVQRGEILGIIGRNGAGKSTLLKILSRVTLPTSGECRVKGRVASLLDVGTGFHPELTGREDIFLNGVILGMTKEEIRQKFGEIVDFSGVDKFIDTPVKRYSSGMYVRLAFAVAAHLEPEILIVDEVLAVGDMSFQKKCLGKMETVSKEGRTVLFVSHSMPSITSLCGRCLLLYAGLIIKDGSTSDVVLNYYTSVISSVSSFDYRNSNKKIGDEFVQLVSGWLENDDGEKCSEIELNNSLKVCMHYKIIKNRDVKPGPNFHFYTSNGTCAFVSGATNIEPLEIGEYIAICHVPSNILNEGSYFIGLAITSTSSKSYHVNFLEEAALCINVRDPMDENVRGQYAGPIPGVVRPSLKWTVTEAE